MFTSPKFRIGDRVYRKNNSTKLFIVKAFNPDIVNDSGYLIDIESEDGKIKTTVNEDFLISDRDVVFAVIGHSAWEDGEETKLYGLTKNFTRAKEKLSEVVERERAFEKETGKDWVENEGNTDTYFESWVDGSYSYSHFYAYIVVRELE